MPEIAEVHRIVHFIRQHLVGKTIATVKAQHDESVFGKVGTSAAEFEKAVAGKKIVGAGQQGKYFWLEMSSPPHPVLHFGMTGWFYIKDQHTYYYKSQPTEQAEWPPKYWKFLLQMKAEKGAAPVEAAYADARRFGRIRLVECAAKDLRKTTPLKENGPDPVIDTEIFTRDFLGALCERKKIPIKALLLDQANISGIGNWVGDEVLYNARIHPEQYANTLQSAQVTKLYEAIRSICTTACDLLAESDRFPENWLFRHRWGKGKKESTNQLPSGERIVFVTVGGRTSAVVPSVQKKTGPVAGDVEAGDAGAAAPKGKPAKVKAEPKAPREPAADSGKKRKRGVVANGTAVKKEEEEDGEEPAKKAKASRSAKAKKAVVNGAKKATAAVKAAAKSAPAKAAKASATTPTSKPSKAKGAAAPAPAVESGRRRSARFN